MYGVIEFLTKLTGVIKTFRIDENDAKFIEEDLTKTMKIYETEYFDYYGRDELE
jgi:hypothetical protein